LPSHMMVKLCSHSKGNSRTSVKLIH
jgi:hypothetical protein